MKNLKSTKLRVILSLAFLVILLGLIPELVILNGGKTAHASGGVTISEFSLGTGTGPGGIINGPDGNLWFTENTTGAIDRITPQGQISRYLIPINNENLLPMYLAFGADGNLWFTV